MPPSPASPASACPPPASQPTGLRGAVERLSLPVLQRLVRLPRAVPFLVLLGLLVLAIFTGGALAVACTALVTAVVGWLLYLSWPRLTGVERLGRVAVLAMAVALCLVQVFPRD